MVKKQRSLQGVTLEYPMTLFDTSALFEAMNGRRNKGDTSHLAKILVSERIFDSTVFLKSFLEQGGVFYITPRVLEEYKPRTLKEVDPSSGLAYELFIEKQKEHQGIGEFIEKLEFEGMVLQLSNEEMEYHSFFHRKYSNFMDREGLSETDLDLLIFGGIISKIRRKPTCLVSNDFPMLYSWKDFVRSEKIAPENFGFFVRVDADIFERAKYPL